MSPDATLRPSPLHRHAGSRGARSDHGAPDPITGRQNQSGGRQSRSRDARSDHGAPDPITGRQIRSRGARSDHGEPDPITGRQIRPRRTSGPIATLDYQVFVRSRCLIFSRRLPKPFKASRAIFHKPIVLSDAASVGSGPISSARVAIPHHYPPSLIIRRHSSLDIASQELKSHRLFVKSQTNRNAD